MRREAASLREDIETRQARCKLYSFPSSRFRFALFYFGDRILDVHRPIQRHLKGQNYNKKD